METTTFGSVLREARERRSLSLAELARKTRVPQSSLQLLEAGEIAALPAEVFVRGFIRSYAKSVGVPDAEPLGLFEKAVNARRRAEEAAAATPTALDGADDDAMAPRRGIGLAVFVIIVLLIATITLTMFLRQPPQAGEGLSLGMPAAGSVEAGATGHRPVRFLPKPMA